MQEEGSFLQNLFADMKQNMPDLHFVYSACSHQYLDSRWNTERFPPQGRLTNFTRIYFPLAGEGFGDLPEGKVIHFKVGSIYLIPPFCNLSVRCETHLEKYYTHFTATVGDSKTDIFSYIPTVVELPVTDPEYWIRDFEILCRSRKKLSSASLQPQGLDALEAKASLTKILLPFLRFFSEKEYQFKEKENRITRMEYFIEHHLGEKHLIRLLAEEMKLNINYMSNFFKAETTMTLHKYIHFRRLNAAVRLLLNDNCQIKHIADLLGYEEVRSFERFFRKMTGYSPSAYRMKHSSRKDGTEYKL